MLRTEDNTPAAIGRRDTPPAHVAILGLGPSVAAYLDVMKRLGGRRVYADETWAINALGDVLQCDRVFHMDDLLIQERRAENLSAGNIANMVAWLRTHPGPIYTSVVRPGYPGLVEYPLAAVLTNAQSDPYFNNTAAYAIAYAIHLGVQRISLFGIDFTLANAHSAERGRACCEYWIGLATARGITVTVPETSTLLDACAPERELLYGYDCVDIVFGRDTEGRVTAAFTERADIPSAEEIERRYDHTKHPNRLMEGARS